MTDTNKLTPAKFFLTFNILMLDDDKSFLFQPNAIFNSNLTLYRISNDKFPQKFITASEKLQDNTTKQI